MSLTNSAIPDNLYRFADRCTAADADLRNWVTGTLRPAITAFVEGAMPNADGQNVDISGLNSWTGGLACSLNSIDIRIAKQTTESQKTDAHVKLVGQAFQKAGTQGDIGGTPDFMAQLLRPAHALYTLDDPTLANALTLLGDAEELKWRQLRQTAATTHDARVKDQLNRQLLQHDLELLKLHAAGLSPGMDPAAIKELASVNNKIAELEGIQKALAVGNGQYPHYLLFYSTEGSRGRAAISTGDPYAATTKNITTGVFGMTTKVATMDGDVAHSDKIYNAANLRAPGSSAVVTWYGYDAPLDFQKGHLEVFAFDLARAGAPNLIAFQNELVGLHQGPPAHMTIVAHSYGGMVTGWAAALGPGKLRADDVIFIGSIGTTATGLTNLEVQGTHVYAGRQEWDVAAFQNHAGPLNPDGADPTTFPGVINLRPGRGIEPDKYDVGHNHTSYWDNPVVLKFVSGISVGQPGVLPAPNPVPQPSPGVSPFPPVPNGQGGTRPAPIPRPSPGPSPSPVG